MKAFVYEAVDPSGRKVRGEVEALDPTSLTRTLEQRGLLVLAVETSAPSRPRPRFGFGFRARREVLEVTRALASLLPAGLPLARALAAASNVATGRVATALESVRDRVEHGETLAAALSYHPDLFSPVYLGLVRAGEKSSDLSGAFARLSHQLERDEQMRAKLLSASVYPLLLAILGGLAILVLLVYVIPRFAELLEGTGAILPRSTAVVLSVSTTVRSLWPLFAAAPVLIALFVAWTRTNAQGQRAWTSLLLRLPLIANFVRQRLAGQFARMMGTLVSGGATLVSALDDTVESLADPVARDETVRVRDRVREGSALNRALEEGTLFPGLLAQLIAVGEQSSNLAQFLLKAADIFEEKTERTVQRLVTVLEPMMIVLFGGIVAVVALALLQAIYGINAGTFR